MNFRNIQIPFIQMRFVVFMALSGACCACKSGSDSKDNGGESSYDGGGESTLDGMNTAEGSFRMVANPRVISNFDTPEWDAGSVDQNLFVEGSGSLRWEHAVDADGCFEYGGNTYCYIRLTPDSPLNLSKEEFISMWIHNDTRSAFNTAYHETYEEVVVDWIYLNFIYEGGSYDSLVRLDHVGWRQYAMEKRLFAGHENTEGWSAITDIHMFVTNAHKPITERVVHIDNLTASVLPPGNVPARWLSTFESGSFDPDIGSRLVLGQHVFDEVNNVSQYHLEYTTIIDNPMPSVRNFSSKVFQSHVPQQGYVRAEFETSPMETEEKTYIYAWKEYLPSATFDNVDFYWLALGQWKTYPCEDALAPWGDQICGGGGIFNDRSLQLGDPDQIEVRFRAEPSCYESLHTFEKDVWTAYALEIFWTTTDSGYYRLYRNGVLVDEMVGIKTLFDGFEPGTCDMKWALGVYTNWWSDGAGTNAITYYLDDMAVFDLDHGVTIDEVIAWQER